eukprot:5121141-Pyramimonas_sp.AAC.1
MIPVGEGPDSRLFCSSCCSVISVNSHGNIPSQEFLASPCVPAKRRSGFEGAKSLHNVYIGA